MDLKHCKLGKFEQRQEKDRSQEKEDDGDRNE